MKLYYHPSPNPAKVALFLEEAGIDYEIVPVDTRKGEQFSPDYLALNPNAKTPALVDGDAVIFDSTAILLYLGRKTGKFMPPETDVARAEMLSWMMFIATGIGPYSGQAVHFKHFAPEPKAYAVNRYMYEAERHFGILEQRLQARRFMLGDTYGIVDIALWGWLRPVNFIFGADAWGSFPRLKRLFDEINARPAAERVAAIAARYAFKAEMDEEAKRFMFPQNQRLAAE